MSSPRDPHLVEDLRQLHPPDYRWLLWIAAVGLVLLPALWLWRRRRHTRPAPSPESLPSAWEEALQALDRLLPLLQPDRSREYGIGATEALRRYVERRYGLHAPHFTTLEFLAHASTGTGLAAAQRDTLQRFLGHADWMKFGRAVADMSELEAMHETAVQFVLASRPAAPAAASTRSPATPEAS